jgi:putative membrane protein
MLKQLIVGWIVVAAAFAITAAVVPSVEIDGGVLTLLLIAIVFGLVNALVGPVLRLISLPLTVITFGLFALVINAALLGITAWLLDSLDVGGFFPAVLAAVVLSLVTAVLLFLVQRVVGEPQRA